jgi:hypothetical protein
MTRRRLAYNGTEQWSFLIFYQSAMASPAVR